MWSRNSAVVVTLLFFSIRWFPQPSGNSPLPLWICLTWTNTSRRSKLELHSSLTSVCVWGRGLWLWGVSASRVLTLLLGAAGGDEDLEYYVRECGSILGVHQKLPEDANSGKHILEYILHHVVEFKKFNQVCGRGRGSCMSRSKPHWCLLSPLQVPFGEEGGVAPTPVQEDS